MSVQELLSARLPSTVVEALGLMRALERALPRDDGVVSFLRLYRAVTEAVEEVVRPGGEYADTRFCRWLDVVFANSFFRALRDGTERRAGVPKAWEPLLEARSRPGVLPIQFALAGMNAHINRDLPFALVETWAALDLEPRRGSDQHEDFRRLNGLLEQTEARVKAELVTGSLGHVERSLGRVDDVVAMWKVGRARDAAWVNGETLWALRGVPQLRAEFALAL
ncbi:MAG: DUF5995 family protein, partial [Gaiellaceae bacterium]